MKEHKKLIQKLVSKMTLHFVWSHLSKKQTLFCWLCLAFVTDCRVVISSFLQQKGPFNKVLHFTAVTKHKFVGSLCWNLMGGIICWLLSVCDDVWCLSASDVAVTHVAWKKKAPFLTTDFSFLWKAHKTSLLLLLCVFTQLYLLHPSICRQLDSTTHTIR